MWRYPDTNPQGHRHERTRTSTLPRNRRQRRFGRRQRCRRPDQCQGHRDHVIAARNQEILNNSPRRLPPDPHRIAEIQIRLADIDGSGVADLIYLAGDGVTLYFNQSGNSWSAGQRLAAFPAVDNVAAIQLADLMGNGTACLVWSSPLAGHAGHAMRYVDLMGGRKPHLLVRSANNMGAETVVQYAQSTKFYLADKLAGKPWITKLPFPVHVVERVETLDRISGNRFVTRYAYHHGHFDGVEREFRGFGMVEQWDTEEIPALGAAAPPASGSSSCSTTKSSACFGTE